MKLGLLRQDPFVFFRGADPLFLDFLARAHPLLRAPSMLVCGDLHPGEFRCIQGGVPGAVTIDIVRFIAGVYLAAHESELDRREEARRLVLHFFLACRERVARKEFRAP